MNMNIFFNFMFFVIICKIKCQQVLYEELKISGQKPGEKKYIQNANIERRFLEDLNDYEWHVAHLRNAVFDGRRDCMADTFADKVRRYRKMLKSDPSRIKYVSADALPYNLYDKTEDSCKVPEEPLGDDVKETVKDKSANVTNSNTEQVTSANVFNVTDNKVNVSLTTAAKNVTMANATVLIEAAETTPKIDHRATTNKPPKIAKKKKNSENDTLAAARRASEYMFSSVEYYDDSIEFDKDLCPGDVDVIELDLDQIRSYDLVCESMTDWESLD